MLTAGPPVLLLSPPPPPQVMLGRISTGAQNDLERVTKMAYSQVGGWVGQGGCCVGAVYGCGAVYGRGQRSQSPQLPPQNARPPSPYPRTHSPPLQVAIYGMNEKIGLLSFPPEENQLNKPYSDDTARLIDGEVRALVAAAYARTLALLEERRGLVEGMAQALLEKEVLGGGE